MSALSSAIHSTGHYHVRPRPICLPLSCARSARNGHSRCSSCVLALLDLATRDARTVTNDSAYRLQQTCERSAAGVLVWFCSIEVWRRAAQQRRGAERRPSDGKIKGARCAPVGRQKSIDRSDTPHEVQESTTACRLVHSLNKRQFVHLVYKRHALIERSCPLRCDRRGGRSVARRAHRPFFWRKSRTTLQQDAAIPFRLVEHG
jgi:hypothetical protein